jgi:hypothetical protein
MTPDLVPVRIPADGRHPPLPFVTTDPLRPIVDAYRRGIAVMTLREYRRHRLALGINTHGVPGLYLWPLD